MEPVDGANHLCLSSDRALSAIGAVRLDLTNEALCSIYPANIAEGHNRRSRRAYLNHVGIALGSLAELDTLVELSIRLNFGDPSQTSGLQVTLVRVGQMLHGLARSLDRDSTSG